MANCQKNRKNVVDERRLKLQKLLEETLDSRNVYFQPPETIKMKYPCIVYQLDNMDPLYADDLVYKLLKSYQITLIDPNPDSDLKMKVGSLPRSHFNRFYTSQNLNHYVFTMYF